MNLLAHIKVINDKKERNGKNGVCDGPLGLLYFTKFMFLNTSFATRPLGMLSHDSHRKGERDTVKGLNRAFLPGGSIKMYMSCPFVCPSVRLSVFYVHNH